MSFGSEQLYNPKHSIGLTLDNIDHNINNNTNNNTPKQLSNYMATSDVDLPIELRHGQKFNINFTTNSGLEPSIQNKDNVDLPIELRQGQKFNINFITNSRKNTDDILPKFNINLNNI